MSTWWRQQPKGFLHFCRFPTSSHKENTGTFKKNIIFHLTLNLEVFKSLKDSPLVATQQTKGTYKTWKPDEKNVYLVILEILTAPLYDELHTFRAQTPQQSPTPLLCHFSPSLSFVSSSSYLCTFQSQHDFILVFYEVLEKSSAGKVKGIWKTAAD